MKSPNMRDRQSGEAPASRDDIVAALFDLFRRAGYDGVSVAEISAATGLGKSSLYHHFPGGKPDMAQAVGAFALKSMRETVFAPLGDARPIDRKVAAMLATVDAKYEGGGAPCLVANMLPSGAAPAPARAIITEWIDALTAALKAAGLKSAVARARATEAVVAIEGALIVAQATGDRVVFRETLAAVRRSLLADVRQ